MMYAHKRINGTCYKYLSMKKEHRNKGKPNFCDVKNVLSDKAVHMSFWEQGRNRTKLFFHKSKERRHEA